MVDKPDLRRTWAAGAPALNVQDPDDVVPGKFNAGWAAEIPPFEFFNFIQQLMTQGLAHINERGIPQWDADTEYLGGRSYVTGSDGSVYVAVIDQTGNDPVGDDGTNWKLFLRGLGTQGTLGNSKLLVDLNTVIESGMYYVTSGSNFPSGVTAGHLIVNNNEGIDDFEIGQALISTTGALFTRSRTGAGTWGVWVAVPILANSTEAQEHTDNVKYLSSLRVFQAFSQYGLGNSAGATYQEAVDADNLVKGGFFYLTSTAANLPAAGNWLVTVSIGADANNVHQVAVDSTDGAVKYSRSRVSGTWESWVNMTPLGVGQTWQDVSGSRSLGVTYTNTTGRPIVLSVNTNTGAAGRSVEIFVDGVQIWGITVGGNETKRMAGYAIIPNGATYRVTFASGGSIDIWQELR